MVFVLICTEGNVSEPAYLYSLGAVIGGQAPATITTNVEILTLPLGGNHGHRKLVQAANTVVSSHRSDPGSLINAADESDTIEKWLIVDYDEMHENGIDVETLRSEAQAAGFTLVVNKPNFELFVLANFIDIDEIARLRSNQYRSAINANISALNTKNKAERGFTKELSIPPYSKKKYEAEKLFGMLLNFHPELIERMRSFEMDTDKPQYTEMPAIINRIWDIYER